MTRRNAGFTLVEVVVVVALIALVAVALGAAFTVIIRTTPTAEDRVDDANAVLGLTNWLPQDVASTDDDGFSLPPYTTPCSGPFGDELLQLSWSASGESFFVDYRFVDDGPGLGTIVRYACAGLQPATAIELTPPLERISGNPPVAITLDSSGPGSHRGLEFVVNVLDGASPQPLIHLDAYTANVDSTLPPTTVPGSSTPSTSNHPPIAHDIWVTVQAGTNYIVDLPAFDIDGEEPDYIGYTYTPPPTSEPVTLIPFASGRSVGVEALGPPYAFGTHVLTYDVEDATGATATGTITVTVINTSATSTSTTTSTIAPGSCSASIVSVNPSSVVRRSDGTLSGDIDVEISTSGSCDQLVVAFDPDRIDADDTREEIAVRGRSVVTIEGDDYVWRGPGSPGWSFQIELRRGSNGPVVGLGLLTVEP